MDMFQQAQLPKLVGCLITTFPLNTQCLCTLSLATLPCRYVDVRTQTGFTAVHFAVASNSQQTLAVLLNLGANPLLSSLFDCLDTINCPKGTTALHLAARQGNQPMAKQLLRTYVSRSCVDYRGDPLRSQNVAGWQPKANIVY